MKNMTLSLLAFCLLFLQCFVVSAAEEGSVRKKVLVIYGTNERELWEQRFSEIFQNNFVGDSRVGIFPVFLPLEVSSSDELVRLTQVEQLRSVSADIVISVQQAAGEFLSQWGDSFAPDLPRIYVLPSEQTIAEQQNNPQAMLVLSALEQATRETAGLISQLMPDIKQVYVVSGSSERNLTYLSRIISAVDSSPQKLEFNYLIEDSPSDLLSELGGVPSDSALLLSSFNGASNGSTSSTSASIASLLGREVDLPLFVLIDTLLEYEVVGGSVTSSELYAELATSMVRQALFDEINGINSTASTASTVYMFNGEQLSRWGVNRGSLPEDSTIQNEQYSIWREYGWQLGFGAIVILVQLISIIGLFEALVRQRQAERERDQQSVAHANQDKIFESVINCIPDAIIISDKDQNVFAYNKAAEEMFGFDQGDLEAGKLKGLINPGPILKGSSLRSILNLRISVDPHRVICSSHNGEQFPGEAIASSLVGIGGEPMGSFALIRDITRRLSEEEEKRQDQKMRGLGKLVGGISHDFNNVLGVIAGYAELCLLDCDESEETTRNLNQILSATDRAKSLVSQIMTFSKDNSTEQIAVNLMEVLEETIELLKVSVPGRIEIITDIDDGPHQILGSTVQLQQIIMNLTTNASFAMKQTGGTIKVGLKRQKLDQELHLSHKVLEAGNYQVLSIGDTGPGMSAEVLDQIFEPFFTTKEKDEGSGMGMTIVYKLTQAHGAAINLSSSLGEGSCITLYFKEHVGSLKLDSEIEYAGIEAGHGQRILLVDDEEELLLTGKTLLSSIGYQVEAFSDPEEAVLRFQSAADEFDLLLTDEKMPHLTGVQLAQQVRLLRPQMPVIVCTGYSEDLNRADFGELGLSGIIRKPFTLLELSRTISRVLCE